MDLSYWLHTSGCKEGWTQSPEGKFYFYQGLIIDLLCIFLDMLNYKDKI